MKKTIEQEVAELTYEQKNNLKRIYKKLINAYICLLVVGIIISIGSFVFVSVKAEQAKDRYDSIATRIQINEINNQFDLSLYEERDEAFDDYYDMKGIQPFMLGIGCVVILIGTAIQLVLFKKKYPYFSEKKYTHLKKSGYYDNPQPQNTDYYQGK